MSSNYKFYGSLGMIPVFLLWIYLSWIIVLFGAERTDQAQNVARRPAVADDGIGAKDLKRRGLRRPERLCC